MNEIEIFQKLKEVVDEKVALKIAEVITETARFYNKLVTKDEFKELKEIVAELAEAQKKTEERLGILEEKMEELAEAQKKTEQRVGELAEAQKRTEARVEELAEAQKRTEARVEELAEAQKRTEARVEELAEAQKRTEARVEKLAEAQRKTEEAILELTKGLTNLRKDFGGFSLTMSYAFENEAFKHLPKVLKKKYNIAVKEKFIRKEVGGKELNLFGKGQRDGVEVYIIGESKLRLEEKEYHNILSELDEKEEAVKEEYGDVEVVKVLITHYAKKGFIKKAEDEGIIIVQSFEW